jgi:hypothetical protein
VREGGERWWERGESVREIHRKIFAEREIRRERATAWLISFVATHARH